MPTKLPTVRGWMTFIAIVVGVQAAPMMPSQLRLGLYTTGTNPRLTQSSFTYVGAFKLPSAGAGDTFDYASGSSAFYQDPGNGATLFIVGAKGSGTVTPMVAEVAQIAIPGTINNPNVVGLGGLTTGTAVQNFADISDGLVTTAFEAYGQLAITVYQNMIIGTAALDYDGSCNHANNAFVAPVAFSSSATGMYHWTGALNARFIGGGLMGLIPSGWQSAFGAKVLSGNGPLSILSCSSSGPSIHTIDADTLITQPSTTAAISTTPTVYYPISHPRIGVWDYGQLAADQTVDGLPVPYLTVNDPHHGGATPYTVNYNHDPHRIHGVLFPDNTSSVITVGEYSLGITCYGDQGSGGPPVSPGVEGDLGTGTNASTNATGLTVTLPNANTDAMAPTSENFPYLGLTTQTTPSYYIDGGGHPGVALITGKGNSGTPSAFVTVDHAFPPNLTSQAWRAGSKLCYDPDDVNKGTHAFPYTLWMTAYDVNDLLAVKNGTKLPYEIAPYTAWPFTVFGDATGHRSAGVSWDPATRRAYVLVARGNGDAILVHVFTVQ